MGEFVGKRVVPDHVGVWDQKKTYEPLMIVLDGETGDSYISRKAVPVGISLADESYWSLCAHYSAQMRKLEQDVDVDVQQMHSDVTAVKNAMSQEFKETHTAISKELDDTHKAISQELSETEQRVNENLEQTSSELTGKVEQAKSDLNTGRQELKDAKDTLNKRMDSIAGGKTSDAEILDARVDSYGHTHNTLGNAIRALRAGEMREAVHEQLAEKYVQELLETEVKKIHGGELYYPYDSSTFSGWVSSYLIDESILVTGIEFIVKARSERISQIRVAIAVRPCDGNNPNAIHWGKLREGRWCALSKSCRGLAKTLFDIMDWDQDLKYRFRGDFIENDDQKVMLFQLDEPEMVKTENIVLPPKEAETDDRAEIAGRTVKQIINILPPEWEDTFGRPITSIGEINLLEQRHYAADWDVLRPAKELAEYSTLTSEDLEELLHEAEKIIEGWPIPDEHGAGESADNGDGESAGVGTECGADVGAGTEENGDRADL